MVDFNLKLLNSKHNGFMETFPQPVTTERNIPLELWPDLPGVIGAKVVTWDPTLKNWEKFWIIAARFPIISVDCETDGLKPFHGSRICGVAAAFYDGEEIQAGYWNFRHRGHGTHPWCQKHAEDVLAGKKHKGCERCDHGVCPGYAEDTPALPAMAFMAMIPAFTKVIIAGQNFKYDCKMFWADGLKVPNRVLDTMLIAHLWDENRRGQYNLDALAKEMGELKLGDTVKEYMEQHGLDVTKTGHAQVPFSVEQPYAVRDAVLVLRRLQFERLRWQAANDPKLMDVFQIENAQTVVCAQAEINGMKMDTAYIQEGITHLQKELDEVQAAVYAEAGKEFDVLSTKQLWDILEARGLKPKGLTPGGSPMLGANELEAYARDGDLLVNMILAYRSKYKILNTYLAPFRDEHVDPSGFLHADFYIHGTVSGRLSCREPNLQNISRPEVFMASNTLRGATAKMIQAGVDNFENTGQTKVQVRRCFVPRGKDYSMFFFDYSQMELRIFSDYAEEAFMLKVLEEDGADLHESVAREIFPDFPDKEKNPLLFKFFRQLTKQINFGIIYGMGVNKLALQLNVPVDETVRYLRMVQVCREEGKPEGHTACPMTDEEVAGILEDHRVMTATRQWSGLKKLSNEVKYRVNPDQLEKALFVGNEHLGLRYSARSFLDKYHGRFPKIKQFTKGLESVISRRGYIFNRYGRRYHMKTEEAYVGVNRLVQGTTADQVKVAMHRIHRLLMGKKSVLLNQVHDEVQIDLHHSELYLVPLIKQCMEYYPTFGVKMLVEVDYAHTSWAEKTKYKGEDEFTVSLGRIRDAEAAKPTRVAPKKQVVREPSVRSKKVQRPKA